MQRGLTGYFLPIPSPGEECRAFVPQSSRRDGSRFVETRGCRRSSHPNAGPRFRLGTASASPDAEDSHHFDCRRQRRVATHGPSGDLRAGTFANAGNRRRVDRRTPQPSLRLFGLPGSAQCRRIESLTGATSVPTPMKSSTSSNRSLANLRISPLASADRAGQTSINSARRESETTQTASDCASLGLPMG